MIRIAVSQQTTFRAQYRSSERDADATFAADDRAFVVQTAISPKDKYRHSTVAELKLAPPKTPLTLYPSSAALTVAPSARPVRWIKSAEKGDSAIGWKMS